MNFDLSFEQKTFIVIGVLLAIAVIPLIRNMISSTRSKLREESDSVHDDAMPISLGDTFIIPGGRPVVSEQVSTVPLLAQLRRKRTQTETGPDRDAPEKFREAKHAQAVAAYEQACTTPFDQSLVPWTKKSPPTREILPLVDILPLLSAPAATALVRIFATSAENEALKTAFKIRGELKDEVFCTEMRVFYMKMLELLADLNAPKTCEHWQGMLDELTC